MSDTQEYLADDIVLSDREARILAILDAPNGSDKNEASNVPEDVQDVTSKLFNVSIIDSLRTISVQADSAVEMELKSKGFSDIQIEMLKNKALTENKSLLQYTIQLCTVEQNQTNRSVELLQDRGNGISL